MLAASHAAGQGDALNGAKEWLRDFLLNAPKPATDVKQAAERDGIKSRTLTRAKEALEVRADREGYASEGRWMWSMPHSVPSASKDAKPSALASNGDVGTQRRTDEWGRWLHDPHGEIRRGGAMPWTCWRGNRTPPIDPDLGAIVAAWGCLPGAIQAGVLALVKAASQLR